MEPLPEQIARFIDILQCYILPFYITSTWLVSHALLKG